MLDVTDVLRCLDRDVSEIRSFVRDEYRPENGLSLTFEGLQRTCTEEAAFVQEAWRNLALSTDESRNDLIQEIQEHRYRLYYAVAIFDLRKGTSTERKILTEVRGPANETTTVNIFHPRGESIAVSAQPTVNVNVYHAGTMDFSTHTANTNSGHTSINSTIASANQF